MADVTVNKFIPHDWKMEGKFINEREFKEFRHYWICRNCGSSGGPVPLPAPEEVKILNPSWTPFLAGTPLIGISDDCEKARQQIDEFVATYPVWKEYADKIRAVRVVEIENNEFPAVINGVKNA